MLRDLSVLNVVFAILGIGALIAWHELGHYVLARLCGMRVLKYSLGFGPALAKFTHQDIQYQISALPLGGYVQIFGMTPYEEGAVEDPRSFLNQPRWQRILVMAAGPGFNYALAAFLFAITLALFPGGGLVIDGVEDGSPAATAGLVAGDTVTRVDGKTVRGAETLTDRTRAAEPVKLVVQRTVASHLQALTAMAAAGRTDLAETLAAATVRQAAEGDQAPVLVEVEVTPTGAPGEGRVGARLRFGTALGETVPPHTALWLGVKMCWTQSVATLSALARMFDGDDSVQLDGPLGIGRAVTRAVERGVRDFLLTLGVLSVSLGLINLLPLPALDGIKILVLIGESALRRDLAPKIQLWVNAVGFLLLLALLIGLTVSDAADLWNG